LQPVPGLDSENNKSIPDTPSQWNLRLIVFLILTLILFLFAVNLMVASLQQMGDSYTDLLLSATSNPFTALFIGLIVTAIFQSSSTTTSLLVALVASGSITIQAATPIIMGANIGTTLTSTLVALTFINKKKEFKRAIAAGSYHDFFNILTALILFPLEYYHSFLSGTASDLTGVFYGSSNSPGAPVDTQFNFGFNAAAGSILKFLPYPVILALVSLVLLLGSILLFRKISANLLHATKPEVFRKFFFQNRVKSFLWGIVTTAAIRSSTITTSVVVPLVAKKISTLKKVAPFILGANMGTTITAFIAVSINVHTREAITIALVHFLFNGVGVSIFFLTPILKELPLYLANGLGRLTLRYRLVGFVYLLGTFFLIPFSLIYINRDSPDRPKPATETQNPTTPAIGSALQK
jgi:solute carrier family 34 (sodium-dependent phosphate cotransporter)